MKKILVCLNNFDVGGVTAVVSSIYKRIDKNNFKMDFIAMKKTDSEFETEVLNNGDKIYYINDCGFNRIPFFNYYIREREMIRRISDTVGKSKYDAVHIHANADVFLLAAKKMNVPIRILHTHEAVTDFRGNEKKSKLTAMIWKNRLKLYNKLSTIKAGDSLKACKAKFGETVVNDSKLQIIYPPVDMEKFNPKAYCEDDIIKEFDIDTKFFNMVHVGRLNPVKNQSFMIDILKEINKVKPARLYIIGDGDLKDKLKAYAKEQGMEDNVIFLPGNTTPGIYTVMDCSLLPSFSEAFGMVAVESQLMGVPCFASDNVPEDVDIGMCSFTELDIGLWTDKILRYAYDNVAIINTKKERFSIEKIVEQVSELYAGKCSLL